MKDVLQYFGNTPAYSAAIASLYPDLSGRNQKIAALEKSGSIIKLKRGLYVIAPEISGKRLSTELIANHIYSPSYVSMLTALRWYGLIPERVSITQSMTIKHTRKFTNRLGHFEYTYTDPKAFPIGLRSETDCDISFIIASPEKALCDLIANTSGVNLRYLSETQGYLQDYLRLDMDEFRRFDLSILEQYAQYGKKRTSIETLIRLLKR